MNYDEKATVSIDAEGNVLRCAKGAAPGECGYVKGADICAKCGAMPVAMKMVPVAADEEMEDEEIMDDEMEEMAPSKTNKKMKKRSMKGGMPMVMDGEDEEMMMDDEEEAMMPSKSKKKKMKKTSTKGMPKKKNMMVGPMDEEMDDELDGEDVEMEEDEDMMDDEEMSTEMSKSKMRKKQARAKRKQMAAGMMDDEDDMDEEDMDEEDMDMDEEDMDMDEEDMDDEDMDDEDMDEEDDEDEMPMGMGTKSFAPLDKEWESLRRARIQSMGMKVADLGQMGYVCALERKAYPGSAPVCADCPGGCVAEKGMPGILHVEGLAEKVFNGSVIDSGYSPDADMFVVDVQAKDGAVREVFIDGTTAEVMGFHKLDNFAYKQKSLQSEYSLIDFTQAAEIAVKSIDGNVVAVEPDIFEGFDAYAVEIDGFDGKSYDVFVGLDGEVLGYDRYEIDEAEQIEAEAAELAIKRAFSEERRMELAKEGMALPDGSYPIVSEADLRNAIQAFGRAKDKEAAKRHIMKRARDMKLESLIPANWSAGASEKSGNKSSNDSDFMAAIAEFQLLEDQLDNE